MPKSYPDMKHRLLANIEVAGLCWIWIRKKHKNGYGQLTIRVEGKVVNQYAHRVSYEVFKGEIGEGLHVDHICNNRACINPNHLEAVTCKVNQERRVIRRRIKNGECVTYKDGDK